MSGQFSGLACLASSALSLSLGRVMPHRLDAMLANRWFILAPTSLLSVKSASRDFRRSTSALASAVLAVTSTSLGFDSSRNSVMSASEGEILNLSSSRLRLPDALWSSSPDSESALEGCGGYGVVSFAALSLAVLQLFATMTPLRPCLR